MFYPLLLLLLGLIQFRNHFSQAIIVRASGMECKVLDPAYLNFTRCELKPVSRGVKEIFVDVKLFQKPVDNVTLRFEIRRRNYPYKPLYWYEIDACAFMRNTRRNPLASLTYDFIKFGTYSNINHTCPYNHDLVVSGLRVDDDTNLRLPIEKGNYAFYLYWSVYNVMRSIVKTYVQLVD